MIFDETHIKAKATLSEGGQDQETDKMIGIEVVIEVNAIIAEGNMNLNHLKNQ